MTLDELNTLVKVVQTGSFTAAAQALGSQKAHVSRVISQLESKLGVRLLERSTRALSLTEVGREMHDRAVRILAAVEDAQLAAQRTRDDPQGVLKLSCGVEFGMLAVGAWVAGYLEKFPQVQVQADYSSRLVDIVHEGFDVAVRVGNLPDSSLAARKLGELRYGLFANPKYLANRPTPLHPNDLAAHQRLVFSGGSHTQHWPLSLGAELVKVAGPSRFRVNNIFAVRDAALAGLGIAHLPLLIAQPLVHTGQLLPVLAAWQLPTFPVHAVFASSRYLAPKVRAFIDHALDSFDSAPMRAA